jgi:hypothetical protein
MGFKVYDSESVKLIAVGVLVSEGRGKTFVKVSQDEASFGTVVGTDGSVVRYAMRNPVHTVEVTLLRSSKHNAQFSALHAADCAAKNGAGVGVFALEDLGGSTIMASPHCWISKPADWEAGQEMGECTWTLQCEATPTTMIRGGN